MGSWKPVIACLDHVAIVKAYESGKATYDIAKEFNTSIWAVSKICHKYNIPLVNTRYKSGYVVHNKCNNIKDEELKQLYQEGKSNRELANYFNCKISLVRQRLASMKLVPNPFHFEMATNIITQIGQFAFDNLSNKEWLELQYVRYNKTTRMIAAELGCGKKTVSTFLKRHNIPIKRMRKGVFRSEFGKCKEFWYDSLWELEIARRMDIDPLVDKFIKEPFPIIYNDNKKYFPDFLVFLTNKRIFLLEVKPEELIPLVEDKLSAGHKSNFEFYVIQNNSKFPWNQ